MYQLDRYGKHIVRLETYKSANNNGFFIAKIEALPKIGLKTPDINEFKCDFKSLNEATKWLRKRWSEVKKERT